jgi:hypothetical protein
MISMEVVKLTVITYCVFGTLFFIYMVLRASVPRHRYKVTIGFSNRERVNDMSDTSIVVGAPAVTATATIRDGTGAPVSGAVFDATPTWTTGDATIATGVVTGVQTFSVTAVAVGVTSLTVTGNYLTAPLTATAQVTVTAAAGGGGFAVTIDWAPPATGAAAAAAKKA